MDKYLWLILFYFFNYIEFVYVKKCNDMKYLKVIEFVMDGFF